MCIIIYSPNGSIPEKQINEGLLSNPHGWGFMFTRDKKIVIRKGMTPLGFWSQWDRDQHDDIGPVVFHARIATHGTVGVVNCHPFPLASKHGLAMAHNGMISSVNSHTKHSDTRQFVKILNRLPVGFLQESGIRKLIACSIGQSKLVFMDSEGNVDIVNESKGFWQHGRWYSNNSCFPPIVLPQTVAKATFGESYAQRLMFNGLGFKK